MDINRNNCEAYLLDLMEGNLSEEDQVRVRDFLLLNPDLAWDSGDFEPWILENTKIPFPMREQLRKDFPDSSSRISEHNFDLFSIARLEGDLTTGQELAHDAMVEKSEKRKAEWKDWKHTKLAANHVIYSDKDELKKDAGPKGGRWWISVVLAAAAVALLIALLRMNEVLPEVELAHLPPAEEAIITSSQAIKPLPEEDEPVMFSIKKNPDRPVESSATGGSKERVVIQDSLTPVLNQKVQAQPVRIASLGSSYIPPLNKIEYDRILPLEIPPTDIHLSSLSLTQISEIDLQETLNAYTEEKDISLWSIASAGIKGINKITGADISLVAAKDDNGDLSGFRFKSKRLSVTSPLAQSD